MLEKWKSAVDKGKSFGALLTDLYKAFDCLSHEVLLAKLHAYRFSIARLRPIHRYLTNRLQRTKIKYVIQFLGRNYIWGTTRICSRVFVAQHFSVRSFSHNEGN